MNWEHIAKATLHPTQVAIVEAVAGREASPRQLSDELAVPLATLSHHVRMLAKAGVLELVREQRRKGGMQHFYRLA